MMGIYKITNLKNGKVYVGSAKDIRHRKLEHIRELKGGFHANRHLQYAYNKYGDDAFIHEDLEEVLEEENLLKREFYWINKLRALDSNYGYNTCPPIKGGEPNREFREKVEGERNGRVLIKAKDVPVICKLLNEKKQRKEIAKMFGVSIAVIEGIKSGRRWRDLSQVYLSDEIISTWRTSPSPKGIHPDHISIITLRSICNEINDGVGDEEIGDKYGLSDAAIASIRKGGCRYEETIHLLDDEVLRLWPYNIHMIGHLLDKQPSERNKRTMIRLTPMQIEKICQMINNDDSTPTIANTLNISKHTIDKIRTGKTHRKFSMHYLNEDIRKSWDAPEIATVGATDHIEAICKMLNEGEKRGDIAERFNVSLSAIREIHNGKTHSHISSRYLNKEIIEKWNHKYFNNSNNRRCNLDILKE